LAASASDSCGCAWRHPGQPGSTRPAKEIEEQASRPDHRCCARNSRGQYCSRATWAKKRKKCLPCGCLERLFRCFANAGDVLPFKTDSKSKLIRELRRRRARQRSPREERDPDGQTRVAETDGVQLGEQSDRSRVAGNANEESFFRRKASVHQPSVRTQSGPRNAWEW